MSGRVVSAAGAGMKLATSFSSTSPRSTMSWTYSRVVLARTRGCVRLPRLDQRLHQFRGAAQTNHRLLGGFVQFVFDALGCMVGRDAIRQRPGFFDAPPCDSQHGRLQ